MALYVVTGGAGFIGSHIVEQLVHDGHTVRVIDNLISGRQENLKDFRHDIEFFAGDIRDYELVSKVFKGANGVFHQAALSSVPQSVEDPLETSNVNITGTLTTLLAARDVRVERFIFASSSSVYGGLAEGVCREDQVLQPQSPYGLTKMVGEEYCRLFYELYGLKTVMLRYFNVFGPRQLPDSAYAAVIPLFASALLSNKQAIIEWDGKQTRDFTAVKNIVAANIAAMTGEHVSYAKPYNIATGTPSSINDLYTTLAHLLDVKVLPQYVPMRAGDIRNSCADISRAAADLKYKPDNSFKKDLQDYVDWCRARHGI